MNGKALQGLPKLQIVRIGENPCINEPYFDKEISILQHEIDQQCSFDEPKGGSSSESCNCEYVQKELKIAKEKIELLQLTLDTLTV